jgi:hypothetical protein
VPWAMGAAVGWVLTRATFGDSLSGPGPDGALDPEDEPPGPLWFPIATLQSHAPVWVEPPRPLTSDERETLSRLLSVSFAGNTEFRRQIPHLKVELGCEECPTIAFLQDGARQPGPQPRWPVPVQAEAHDEQGAIQLLLHVRDGLLVMLEVSRPGGGRIERLPGVSSLRMYVSPAAQRDGPDPFKRN